ncbi:hypothetical protein, partial [Escherichia coli]|uniref:hypothetical protein n=1 Tax=Escherichia coli TaxID=562 RepID=UPI0021C89901
MWYAHLVRGKAIFQGSIISTWLKQPEEVIKQVGYEDFPIIVTKRVSTERLCSIRHNTHRMPCNPYSAYSTAYQQDS